MRTTHPIGLWENKNCTEAHNYICETARTGFTNAPTTQLPILPCPSGWTPYSLYCYKVFSFILMCQSYKITNGIFINVFYHGITEIHGIFFIIFMIVKIFPHISKMNIIICFCFWGFVFVFGVLFLFLMF